MNRSLRHPAERQQRLAQRRGQLNQLAGIATDLALQQLILEGLEASIAISQERERDTRVAARMLLAALDDALPLLRREAAAEFTGQSKSSKARARHANALAAIAKARDAGL